MGKPERSLCSADGSSLSVAGVCRVEIRSTYRSVDTPVYVLTGSRKNLLGLHELRQLNLLAVVNSMCKDDFDPTREFPDVFQGLGTLPGTFKINLKDNMEPKCLFTPRPIAAGLKDQAKRELDQMLASGIIEPVDQPTEWCSGLTIAPKPGGKIRMCVDLTNLNKSVKREIYPLPRISEMLSNLSEGSVFSKLDAYSGFWQVNLHPESKLLTTFVTPWGRFCFNKMPFGISSAPEYFQKTMEKILQGLKGVVCLMDDVLVYGETVSEHWLRLRKVLERIKRAGMTLKKEKCEFGCSEIKFLGHIVSSVGVRPDPDKIQAILDILPPSNKLEARRFIGMVNYLSKFSNLISEYCTPIYAVTGSKSEWYWGVKQQEGFEKIKKLLTKAPILCAFDITRKHRVSADASKNAVGAVLLQLNCDNLWQPVEYASRTMRDAEVRYAQI